MHHDLVFLENEECAIFGLLYVLIAVFGLESEGLCAHWGYIHLNSNVNTSLGHTLYVDWLLLLCVLCG